MDPVVVLEQKCLVGRADVLDLDARAELGLVVLLVALPVALLVAASPRVVPLGRIAIAVKLLNQVGRRLGRHL